MVLHEFSPAVKINPTQTSGSVCSNVNFSRALANPRFGLFYNRELEKA